MDSTVYQRYVAEINPTTIANLTTVTPISGDIGIVSVGGVLRNFDFVDVLAGSGDMELAGVQTVTGAKTFGTIGGAVGKFILAGSTSGSTILNAAGVAGSTTMTLPTATTTLIGTGTADTLTNKSIDAANNTVTNIGSNEIKAEIISGQSLVTAVSTDMVLLWDNTDSALKRADAADFLAGSGDMILANVQTVTGAKTFADDAFLIQNPAITFEYLFQGGAIVADRTITLPVLTGGDTIVFEAHTATLTNKTLTSPTLTAPVLGTPSSGNLGSCTAYPGDSSLVTTGALNSGSITSGFGAIDNGASNITTTGDITGGGIHVTGDTAIADNAALGYTATEGLILTGQGSTNDITFKNDADTTVMRIPTGATGVTFAGVITATSPSFTTPVLGTPSSGNLSNCTAYEGIDVLSTGEGGGTKFLREDGDGTCSWQAPAGSGDMVLADAQTVTGAKTFADNAFLIQNPAVTFEYLFQGGAIVADRTITLPVLTGGDTLVFEAHIQTLTNKVIDSDNNTITNIVNADVKAAAGIVTSKLAVPILSSPTYDTAQDFDMVSTSGGIITGGILTDGGSGTVDLSAGTLLLRSTNSAVGNLFSADFSSETGQALTDNSANFLYIEYNSGTPQLAVSTSPLADVYTNIVVGIVYRIGSTVHITNVNTPPNQVSQKLGKRFAFIDGLTRQAGSVTSETGTRNISITSGMWWLALAEYSLAAVDTSAAGTFTYWYDDGASGWTSVASQTQIDNTQYDDGSGTLATLSNAKHGVHWGYISVEGDVEVIYGTTNGTLSQAQDSVVPTSLPPHITGFHVGLIFRIIILKSASVFTEISNPFTSVFTQGVATSHGDLSDLAVDDHTQYLLTDGSRTLTGNQDFAATNITTTGDITGGGIHVTGDTSADDNAALGYTASEGLILTGQGSTNDITFKNDADTVVFRIPTGATGVTFAGVVTGTTFIGALTGQADTVGTITGLAPDTATTQATQAAITSCANLVTVGTVGTGVWEGTVVANAFLDADTAHLAVAQTFTEVKQFSKTTNFTTEVDNGNSGTADTIDWTAGNKQKSTLTGTCTFTFSPAPDGPCSLILRLIQGGAGSFEVVWPATVQWPGGTAPGLTDAVGSVDLIAFYFDGTDYHGNFSLDSK